MNKNNNNNLENSYLSIKNLTKFYGSFKALDNISFEIKKGEITGFLGPNGAGKTTTFKILAGLLTSYEGEIYFNRKKYSNIGCMENVKFIFDSQNFYENLTALENLKIISRLNNKRYSKKHLIQTLEKLGIGEWAYNKVKSFSRGMKQRLALCIAELEKPDLLILDEPTNGLDIKGINTIENSFLKLNKDYGTTILLSSHYLEQVERLSNHIIIINHGKIIFNDKIQKFLSSKTIGIKYILSTNIDQNISPIITQFFKNNGLENIKIEIKENEMSIISNQIDNNIILKFNIFLINNNLMYLYINKLHKNFSDIFQEEIENVV